METTLRSPTTRPQGGQNCLQLWGERRPEREAELLPWHLEAQIPGVEKGTVETERRLTRPIDGVADDRMSN